MRANTPRPWTSLPPAQRKQIEEYALKMANQKILKDERIMLDLYMKMVCLTLHNAFGFGEKRLNMFLGNHKQLFNRQRRMVKNDTQIGYLNEQMAEIFKKDGFPQKFLDDMLGVVDTSEQEGGK